MNYKLIFILIFGFGLVSSANALINVTLPIEAPTNLNAELVAGGTLDASTTYYYIVVGHLTKYLTPAGTNVDYHSPISEEGNFTTNTTHKSAKITWTNSVGHVSGTNYMVFITKNSGDYTYSDGYERTDSEELLWAGLRDGTTGYTVTSTGSGTYKSYISHSIQVVNPFVGNLSKETGVLKVYIDNETIGDPYRMEPIYDAIVDAGYSDYVFYDGYNFYLKGWIIIDGTNPVDIDIRDQNLVFIKGGMNINNANATVTFGRWVDDYTGADYGNGVTLELQNSRYPLKARGAGQLEIFGSRIVASNLASLIRTESEHNDIRYYHGGAQLYHAYYIEGIKDVITQLDIRGISSEVYDLKTGIGNNWLNQDVHRMTVTDNRVFCYSNNCRIYDTTWVENMGGTKGLAMYVPATCAKYSTFLYDPTFTQHYDTNNNLPPTFYFRTDYGCLVSQSFIKVHNSIIAKVIDEDGNPIEGVKVALINSENREGVWIEHEGGTNRKVTGNTYDYNVSTDADGTIDYYVLSYNVTLNQSNTEASSTCENYIKSDLYPYSLSFSKDGYKNYTIYLSTLTKKTNLIISLEEQPEWNYSWIPEFKILNESKHTIFKITDDGNLAIAGKLYEDTNSPPPTANIIWRIKDFFWFDIVGNLYIKGWFREEG